MTTPLLLDVPKTHMSRYEQIRAFKERKGIWTYRSNLTRQDHPWLAMLEHKARQAAAGELDEGDPDDPISLMACYCRILDEMGLIATGTGELDAIRRLCTQNRIPCEL